MANKNSKSTLKQELNKLIKRIEYAESTNEVPEKTYNGMLQELKKLKQKVHG